LFVLVNTNNVLNKNKYKDNGDEREEGERGRNEVKTLFFEFSKYK